MYLKKLISSINSWNDFKSLLETKTKLEKGKAFEELTKYYLQYNPVYKTKLKNVWLQKETPSSVLKKLNLPTNDQGIDLIAETIEGNYWAIQCKYLQDEDQRLSHRAISTFVSLSTGIAENITYCLVCTTVDEYAKIYEGKENIGFCNSDEWRKLDKTFFDWVRNKLSGKEKKLIAYKPKPHQVKALKEATNYFIKEKNNRGKLVFPCGAGKSLTGYWITRELKSKSIIVAVPSLSLVKQTLEVYLRESVANNDAIAWLCVCSDEGIGKNDDVVIHTNEIGVPCVTNKTVIAKWLSDNSKKKTIIFTTYQSGKTIAEACKIANHSFDLGIMDEAHKTVGQQDKLFSHLLFEKNIKIQKRIFMTATERRYAGSSDEVLSMDDINVYGETFTQMSFKEAIDIGILSDYKIITLFISNSEVRKLIEQNAFVKPVGKEWDKETEARTLASLIALRKAMTEYPIHHAVTFHSSIKKAEAFEQSQAVFSKAYPKFAKVKSFHVSGAMPTSVRGKIVDEFSQTEKGVITNAKCLTEGVDVPNIDCVLFADPRKSTVDIVQAVGRALRKKEGKDFGYVILPVFTESTNIDEIVESDEFKEILTTLRALASNDERIIEYFRDISKGKKGNKKNSLIQFEIDEAIAEIINEKKLIETIELKTWERLARLSWMPFEEARMFVRSLNLKSGEDFKKFCLTSKRPRDIPTQPRITYFKTGWISMGDWIGTGRIADQYKVYISFIEAKYRIQKLNFKTQNDWKRYSQLPAFPSDIPRTPNHVYKEEWKNWGEFLGTNKISNKERTYLPFKDAKKFVQSLDFKSRKGWHAYLLSGQKPLNIPSKPERIYKNKGWKGSGDFFGNNNLSNKDKCYVTIEDAKKFAQIKNIKSVNEWRTLAKNKMLPSDIPSAVNKVYENDGWKGWGDFLQTNVVANYNKQYLTYDAARKYAISNKIQSVREWRELCKSKKFNPLIPTNPNVTYKAKGWENWGKFLGTNKISDNLKVFRSFSDAKIFAQQLKLSGKEKWFQFCKTKNKPDDIPSGVSKTYKSEWKGWADFLGKE